MKNKILKSSQYFLIILSLLFLIGIVARAAFYEANQVGYDIRYGYILSILGAIIIAFSLPDKASKKRNILLASLVILTAVLIFVFDQNNIIVEYEEWIRRGMPARNSCTC